LRLLLTFLLACGAPPALAQGWDDGGVPFVATPPEIVERMLRIAEVGPGDHLIDLGSGDGRIVIAAAKRGATGLGVDLDPGLVRQARENAAQAGVALRAEFQVRDIFETDLSKASVVAFYLLPEFNARLLPRLLALKPGTRIVSHDGGIGAWPPDERLEMRVPEKPVGVGGRSGAGRAKCRGTAGAGCSRSRSASRSSPSMCARRGATCWCARAGCAAPSSSSPSAASSASTRGTISSRDASRATSSYDV
jgi:SAM-dependent methyltransferase